MRKSNLKLNQRQCKDLGFETEKRTISPQARAGSVRLKQSCITYQKDSALIHAGDTATRQSNSRQPSVVDVMR